MFMILIHKKRGQVSVFYYLSTENVDKLKTMEVMCVVNSFDCTWYTLEKENNKTERFHMFVDGNIWVSDYSDVEEIRKKYKQGYRFIGDVEYDVPIVKNQKTWYRFKSTDDSIAGYLYITEHRIKDVFDLLRTNVIVHTEDNNTFVFHPYGMTINRTKTIVYKRYTVVEYFPHQNQYKGISPYGAVSTYVNFHRYRSMHNTVVKLGYISSEN